MADVGLIVEVRLDKTQPPARALEVAGDLAETGFVVDLRFEPIPMSPPPEESAGLEAAGEQLVLIRGRAPENAVATLRSRPEVFSVRADTRVEPFGS